MRVARRSIGAVVCVLAAGAACAADDGAESRFTWSGDVTAIGYSLSNAYFGSAAEQPVEGSGPDYTWLESTARVGAQFALTEKISLNAGVAGVVTLDKDPFGLDNNSTGLVEIANIAFRDLLTPGLDFTLGRQNIKIGDGFLIQDGYADTRAGVWSIPLKFWDAARVDYHRGAFAGTAMVAKLSSSFGQDGELYGVDLAWVPGRGAARAAAPPEAAAPANAEGAEGAEAATAGAEAEADEEPATYLGLGWFAREDSGEADDDARLIALRGSVPVGPLTLAGEYAFQSGKRAGVDLGGEAWHADLRWDLPFGHAPYLFASFLHFSGDDPGTAKDETFDWNNYGADDWSHYYLGELLGSTLFFNTDQDVLKLEAGVDIAEPLNLRLIYIDISADTGAYYGVPEGAGDGLGQEWDAVLTWSITDALDTFLLVSQARPGDAGKALYADETSTLLAAGMVWSF